MRLLVNPIVILILTIVIVAQTGPAPATGGTETQHSDTESLVQIEKKTTTDLEHHFRSAVRSWLPAPRNFEDGRKPIQMYEIQDTGGLGGGALGSVNKFA